MPGRPRTPGSIGYPVWGVEMAILDEKDQPVPDGERGEICIRGHNVMKGYLGRPDATPARGGSKRAADGACRSGRLPFVSMVTGFPSTLRE